MCVRLQSQHAPPHWRYLGYLGGAATPGSTLKHSPVQEGRRMKNNTLNNDHQDIQTVKRSHPNTHSDDVNKLCFIFSSRKRGGGQNFS